MSKKLPALQFYVGDWRKDPGVQALDYERRGVWFELLLLMHESEQRGKLLLNGKAMPDEAIARLLGLDVQKWTKIKNALLDYGVARIDEDTGALMSKRMVDDEDKRQKKVEAGRKGGKKSRPPGEPKHPPKQTGSKPEAEGEAKEGSSVSPSNSTSSSDKKNSGTDPDEPGFDEFWDAYDKKVDKKKSKQKWKKLSKGDKEDVMEFIPIYKAYQPDARYRKNPTTFFNNRSWEDEFIVSEVSAGRTANDKNPDNGRPTEDQGLHTGGFKTEYDRDPIAEFENENKDN